jgi:hypothetical protein
MSGLFGSGGLLEDWELDPRVQRGNSALSALLGHNPATSERKPVPPPFGVDERPPSQSEIDFFNRSGVPGYAAEDGKIVLNPTPPPGINMNAIRLNEGARVFMRNSPEYQPSFALTQEQMQALSSTGYATAPIEDQRATIAARLLSGDPSAGTPTPEQRLFVERLRGAASPKKPEIMSYEDLMKFYRAGGA